VRSGFTVSKALFFNFLSALVALVGTAVVSSSSSLQVPNNILLLLIQCTILLHICRHYLWGKTQDILR
jgi:hypothetical protein